MICFAGNKKRFIMHSDNQLIRKVKKKNDREAADELRGDTDEDSILSFYMSCILRCRSLYDKLDMIDLKEMKEEMSNYHPTGLYKKYIDTGYEKLQRRMGKNVQKIKLSAGLLAGLLTGCILMGITLTGYFTQVSYEGLWDVSVS